MFCYSCIVALFMQSVPAVLITSESSYPHYPTMSKDYDYIYDFLQTDTSTKDSINGEYITQAYNTIRIIWEDSYIPLNITIRYKHIYMQALHKARNYLLSLANLEAYRDDSGLQLAIALSYFLESHAMQYEKIKFYMQKWVELGHEIPKNLVKMTDYKDSIQTIKLLCKSMSICNDITLP